MLVLRAWHLVILTMYEVIIENLLFQDRDSNLTVPARWEDRNLRKYLNKPDVGTYLQTYKYHVTFTSEYGHYIST